MKTEARLDALYPCATSRTLSILISSLHTTYCQYGSKYQLLLSMHIKRINAPRSELGVIFSILPSFTHPVFLRGVRRGSV